MTRTAFRATLEISNNDPSSPLTSVGAQVEIKVAGGNVANSRFQIETPTLANIDRVDGSGTLQPGTTATIRWLLIPSDEATPTNATDYYVGGQFSYVLGGNQAQVPLEPVKITVYPDAALDLTYFHQRDVFADDPFTPEVEPSVPYALVVMVKNRGAGAARSLRITSSQPQITSNDKGLLIDFKLIGTSLDGTAYPNTMALDFGQINPGGIKAGAWLFTSTLQGFFRDYTATFQHEDTLGNIHLSTIKSVCIRELAHIVEAGYQFADGKADYLVNDVPDPENLPDVLYLGDGATNAVQVVRTALVPTLPSPGNLTVQLLAAMPSGWTYLRVPEPSGGQFALAAVTRSDGFPIKLGTNVWTADRVFPAPGLRPIRTNLLHLLDYNSPGGYILTYTTNTATGAADSAAPLSAVAVLPTESQPYFPVTWSGEDELGGSGLAFFDVLVSSNGGPFQVWLAQTDLRGAVFHGTQGSTYAFYSVAADVAGNREAPPGGADAQTTVSIVNHAPAFAAIPDQIINEGDTFTLNLPVSDSDLPNDALSFSLPAGAPPGMRLDPVNGTLQWPTSEITGPSTNTFSVVVRDSGVPPLSDTGLVSVIVREVNIAPSLELITDRTISEGTPLTITCRASDPDLPLNQLTFSLGPGAPQGAVVDPTTGVFSWRPNETQGPSTNWISIAVTDNGTPSLSATQMFRVVVRDVLPDFVVALGATNLMAGESGIVPVTLTSTLDLTHIGFELDAGARLANLTLQPTAAEVISATLQPAGPNSYAASLTLNPALQSGTTRKLANLAFLAVPNEHSAIVPLDVSAPLGQLSGGQLVTQSAGAAGRVIIVATEPVLDLTSGTTLILYGHPGAHYALEYRTNLLSAPWTEFSRFALGDRTLQITNVPAPVLMAFYRAYEFMPLALSIQKVDGQSLNLTVHGQPGAGYTLQTSTNLSLPTYWYDLQTATLTNGVDSFNRTTTGAATRFFRVVPR